MRKKGLVSIIAAVALVANLCGCSGTTQSSSSDSAPSADSQSNSTVSESAPAEESVADDAAEEICDIRLDVVSTGTQAIPPYIMQKLKLDEKYGFNLVVHESSGSWGAEWTALKTGEIDACITNWLDVARNSEAITTYCVAPMFGWGNNMLVPADSEVNSIESLKGLQMGVYQTTALDWLMLRAVAQSKYGIELESENEVSEAAAGLLMGMVQQGNVNAVFSYADTNVMTAADGNYKIIFNAADCLNELGLDTNTPFLFYTFTEDYVNENPEAVQKFVSAYGEVYDYLMENDEIWNEIAVDLFGITAEGGAEVLRDTLRPVLLKNNTETTEQSCVDFLNWCNDNGYGDLVGVAELPAGFVKVF